MHAFIMTILQIDKTETNYSIGSFIAHIPTGINHVSAESRLKIELIVVSSV